MEVASEPSRLSQTGHVADDNEPQSDLDLLTPLFGIAKAVRGLVTLRLNDIDLVAGQDEFLLCLPNHGALSVKEIADRTNTRPSTVSKSAKVLIKRGLILKTTFSDDDRMVGIMLTEAGREKCRAVCRVHAELGMDLLSRETTSTLPEWPVVLVRLDEVLHKRLSRLR